MSDDRPAPGAAAPCLSVSLVYYDTAPEVFDRALADLGRAIRHLDRAVQVAVVDNSGRLDPDRTRATLHTAADPARVTAHVLSGHGNVGFGRGHNLALAALPAATYHLLLNPDAYLAGDFLVRACRALDRRPDAVALTPYAESPEGVPQSLCKRYPDPLTLALRAMPAWVRDRFDRRIARYEARWVCAEATGVVDDIELASGCCLLCRRDALAAIGGFDARYFLYFEDFDLSLRLRTLGAILFDPESRIVHLGGGVAGKRLRHWRLFAVSAVKFFRRHGFREPRTAPASPTGLITRPRP